MQRLGAAWLACAAILGLSATLPARAAAARERAQSGIAHPLLWPTAPPGPVVRPEVERLVEDLLARMTLGEKVAQMIQADIGSITPEELREYRLGAVLAGGGSAPGGNVRAGPAAWLDLADSLYRASVADPSPRHRPIPILFGIDAVHGDAKIRGATLFPHNIGLGAAHDPQLVESIGRATAQEVAATGLEWTFAPTIAVARDVRWGRTYESYSEDPATVATYAARMVAGLQGAPGTPSFLAPGRTLATAKHFLGDGGTLDGRDQGNDVASERVLIRVHDAGYPAALGAGALVVMASYSSWQGVKMHANRSLLTDVLKGRMGFEGFVLGDWNAQEEIPGCTKYDCPAIIRAGIDMVMAPDSWRELYRNTLREVRSGVIPQSRIDDAVRRILRVKALAGLFGRPPPKERPGAGQLETLGSAAHRALARRAVRESLVLLKNEHGLLPLAPRSRVLVVGRAADSIADQAGGWSVDWQGDHNTNADFPGATSIYAGIRATVTAAGGTVALSPDGQLTSRPDVVIAVYGESPYAEYEGDRETAQFVPDDPALPARLEHYRALGIAVVSIFLSGRPLWVAPELNASDAFVAAWLPGSEGEGVSDVLFRRPDGTVRYDFRGRLGFSWPSRGMPVTFDEAGRPQDALFARGYGLHYGERASLPRLPEDPRIPADRGGPDTLFQSDHVTAPWSIFVADALGQVRMTLPRQRSPLGAVSVELAEGAARVRWSGHGLGAIWIGGRPVDLRVAVRRGDALSMRLRVDRKPVRWVRIGLRCAPTSQAAETRCGAGRGAMLDLSRALARLPAGEWQQLVIPLRRFAPPGVDLSKVEGPFTVETDGAFGLSFSDVRFVRAANPLERAQRELGHEGRARARARAGLPGG